MKKRLICFLILSSFIIGLVFVGSCKDYDDFALDIRVQNLDNRLTAYDKAFSDSIDSIMARLGRINECTCVPSKIKDSIKVLYDYLLDCQKAGDTCSIDTATGKPLQGIGKILNYLNKQMTSMAAQAEVESLKKRIDKLHKDSIKPAFDTASIALDSAKQNAAKLREVADELRKIRYAWSDSVKRALDTANLAYAMADQNSKDIKTLQGREKVLTDSLKLAWDSIRDHLQRIEILEARRDVHSYYDSLRHAVQRADSNKVSIDSLCNVTDELIEKDIVLNKRIDSLAKVTYDDSVRLVKVIEKNEIQDKRIDSLAKVTYEDSVRTKIYLDSALAYADSIADTIRGDIAKVIKEYQAADNKLWAAIQPMRDSLKEAYRRINDHSDSIEAAYDRISAHSDSLKEAYRRIQEHSDSLKTLDKEMKEVQEKLNTIESKLDSLESYREKNISNIRINGTRNDVFGSFALPVNLRSNILMTYYSDFPGVRKFPSTSLPALDGSSEWTANDDELIQSLGELLPGGRVVGESADNAGKLYFTLNPNDVKIDDTYEFYLMTSDNKKTPVALSNIHKSTEKLTFGYSSNLFVNGQVVESDINTDNGFYEADAKIEASDAYSLRPHLDVDKSQLKAVVSDVKNYKDGIDLKGMATTLINTVLKSTDGILDANALYVSWEDAYGKHSAVSDYNLAAFAVKPLSYNTFNSLPLPDVKLPSNPVQYLLKKAKNKAVSETNRLRFHFKTINIHNVEFDIPDVTFETEYADQHIEIYIKATDKDGVEHKDTVKVPFETAYMSIREPLKKALQTIEDDLKIVNEEMDAVVESLRNDINNQVNDFIKSIDGTVQSTIKKSIGEITTEVGNNKYVKKLEALASQISGFYNDHADGFGRFMVQPMLIYLDGNGDLHPMSNSMTIPTQFVGTNQVDLIVTSLTNEIVTPAYKKFIAVTNYVDPVTGKDFQYDKDSDAKDVITSINGNGEIGVVLDGSVKNVTFNAPKKGVYELLLSTIDYDGYVFNRKFYVNVK